MTLHHAEMHFLIVCELPRVIIQMYVATFCRLNNILRERAIERGQTGGVREEKTQVHKEKGREQVEISPREGERKSTFIHMT